LEPVNNPLHYTAIKTLQSDNLYLFKRLRTPFSGPNMLSISPRLPFILALIGGLGMISATAWQAYEFWHSTAGNSSVKATTGSIANQQPREQTPDIELASVSLFGEVNQSQTAPEEDIDNLPETNLQLVLRGVMAASGDFPGSALLEDSRNRTEAYVVGDDLPGNATLKKVRPDRIIIDRGGALENLFFPEQEDQTGVALARTDSNQVGQDYPEQQAGPTGFSGPDASRSSDSRREEIRQRLEQLRNRLRNSN
jgi:general secretion pathway protein C